MNQSTSQLQYPRDLALHLGGIAPNVVRELSGVYPTFVSAFKELISNAYDADASLVTVQISPDFNVITVEDDGLGMTPLEFQNEYLRIGGSMQQHSQELTRHGRRRIGRKGVGFLAIARFCRQVVIQSHADRDMALVEQFSLQRTTGVIPKVSFFQKPFAFSLVPFITIHSVKCRSVDLDTSQYKQIGLDIELTSEAFEQLQEGPLTISYSVDCRQVDMHAVIDYNYLFNLRDDQNLEILEDFCRFQLIHHLETAKSHFTKITLYLRDFIQNELLSSRRRGRVRNISSESGQDHFLWHLGRSIPISYYPDSQELEQHGLDLLTTPISPTPFAVKIIKGNNTLEIKRPLLEALDKRSIIVQEAIDTKANGLEARGYLWGFDQPIFPAELRGIAIRVRGVEVGQPDYLDIDNDLPVKLRVLLNQVMGEINVSEGLDAISAITPGREGFYLESGQFQELRKRLVGDGVSDFGILGKILFKIWERSSIEESAKRLVQEAKQRRDAFLGVSQAVTGLSISSGHGRALRHLFGRSDIVVNGLSNSPEYHTQLPNSIGNYSIELLDSSGIDFELDVENKVVRLNREVVVWDNSLYILGRDFRVSLRRCEPHDPLCEIDFSSDTIYINWMHPSRSRMGDAIFIKSALFWRIAYLATNNNADMMMDMAHRLLTFAT
jgi:hypothetical protein